jgi:serine/threonine protein kinase
MHPTGPEISMCPDCGRRLEEAFGGGRGCMACFLRAGIGGEDDESQDSTPDAFDGYEHFGVYRIDRREDGSLCELGHGAMGTTYRAIDTALRRKVALKIIKIAVSGRSKEGRESFLREARATAALRHENIATVFQFGIHEETGQCFYAMELIEGETLEERVRRAGPLDPRTTIDIARQVTAALGAAEKRGLIHRDLKPANMMLTDSDGSELVGRDRRARRTRTAGLAAPAVKIIDFGLAKALDPPADPIGLTRDGFVGTPAFASPEQFENSALDVRADIYSLGVTLWFALTGKIPFGGYGSGEIHRAQQSDALPMEQLKAAHVPHRLRSLLRSMLAVEPAARPSTRDLAARLQRCAAQANVLQHTRIALAAVFILTFGVSAFLIFPSLRTHPPPTGSPSAPSQMIDFIRTTSSSPLPVKIRPAKRAQENGAPVAPQIEEELTVPEPLERYSVAQASMKTERKARMKTERKASHRRRHVARQRPSLFKKLVAGFMKLQKQPAKSFRKTRHNLAAPLGKKSSPRTSESSVPESFEYFQLQRCGLILISVIERRSSVDCTDWLELK